MRMPGTLPPPSARLSECLQAAFVGFVVGGFFLSLAYSDMLYTLAALAVGLAKVDVAHASRPLAQRSAG
jgi:hypothetical protein